ncbi:protein mono-ADP-ribosyltransferase PARP3-like isoform X1 [Penaeus japonicus]|uniref:protein mono-ADP-ribosyltransferase PARP3-like isoform X1 n=2 Tax=Penaeus japonicus TaxID=27405 RepID=UPI001C714845|nr:protein mono-ADP-ribosyltransferase PARP3-like isoform X1 [Penaeus japonicus]
MPRGRGRGRAATKRKAAADDEEPPAKLEREDSENTKLRKAIVEAKESAQKKPAKRKLDVVLSRTYPKATVYEDYACMLNQTNIGQNNNKFYVIQIVQDKKNFICYTRWGRVGEEGKWNADSMKSADDAIKSFEKKFKDKTRNDWANRENFEAVPKKYTLLEMDDDSDEEDDTDAVDSLVPKKELASFKGPCNLHPRTILMIKLIFSDDMFVNQMADMSLDVKKMPLGKISKIQIAKGLEALIDIEDAIKQNKPRSVLMELTSKFFTLIPHNFGRTAPPVIDTDDVVQKKKEVMLTLSDIELTQSLQKDKESTGVHPLQEKYDMLDCVIEYVDKKSSEYKILHEYATACPQTRRGPLLDVWRVDRKGEKDRFAAHDDIKHRKLLWHGTNVAVVAAILKAGLRIMPHSGGLVGKGIYFASEHAKSSYYVGCHYGSFEGESNVGFMFLVEVALGRESSITQCNCSLTKPPNGYDSVVARGSCEPDPKKNKKLVFDDKDVIVPVGKPVPQKEWAKSGFCQSEYLVYKESQARIRYILKFSFK